MKLLEYTTSGLERSLRSWKWILAAWAAILFLTALLILPLRSGINSILGYSMITEKLKDGINMDVIAGSGTALQFLISSFRSGFFLVIALGILVNVFFSGGFFAVLQGEKTKNNAKAFFSGAASGFWPYLVITLMIYLMILLLLFIITGIPAMILQGSDSETAVINGLRISGIVTALILPVFLLVADYSRAWQASGAGRNPFKAIGKGFGLTFRSFFSSYIVMAIMLIIQIIFMTVAGFLISRFTPVTAGGIFLLFLLTQLLFIIRIFLRTWRYGCVTAMFQSRQPSTAAATGSDENLSDSN